MAGLYGEVRTRISELTHNHLIFSLQIYKILKSPKKLREPSRQPSTSSKNTFDIRFDRKERNCRKIAFILLYRRGFFAQLIMDGDSEWKASIYLDQK